MSDTWNDKHIKNRISSLSFIASLWSKSWNMDVDAARAKMKARFGKGAKRAGAARRKATARSSKGAEDSKKLQAALKKLGCKNIPAVEEVNMFQEDGNVLHFMRPQVSGALESNTYVIQGVGIRKPIHTLLPGIFQQMGEENTAKLMQMANEMKRNNPELMAKMVRCGV